MKNLVYGYVYMWHEMTLLHIFVEMYTYKDDIACIAVHTKQRRYYKPLTLRSVLYVSLITDDCIADEVYGL